MAGIGLESGASTDIAIVCHSFEDSLRFYRDTLGLEFVAELDVPGPYARQVGLAPRGFRQARLRAGTTLIKLMQIDLDLPTPGNGFAAGVRWLTFFVSNVDDTYQRLSELGVPFLSAPMAAPETAPETVAVVCAVDPDNIILEFVQQAKRG